MPSPTDIALMDFEGNIEKAFASQFEALGQSSPALQMDDAQLKTPRYVFQFSSQGVYGGDESRDAIDNNGVQRQQMFRGQLTVVILTDRVDNTDGTHSTLRANIRSILHRWRITLTREFFPYYDIGNMVEAGMNPSVENQQNLDVSTLRFNLVFSIRADAWPVADQQQ